MRIAIAPAIPMIRRCLAILGMNSDRLRYKVFPELDMGTSLRSRTNKRRSGNFVPWCAVAPSRVSAAFLNLANTMREFENLCGFGIVLLIYGLPLWVTAREVSMSDLREMSNPECKAQIDTIGWVFVAAVVVIAAFAGMVAYNANDLRVTNTVSHVAAR
jgi:hypothetical protein